MPRPAPSSPAHAQKDRRTRAHRSQPRQQRRRRWTRAVQGIEDVRAAQRELVTETAQEVEASRAELDAALDGEWAEVQAQIRKLAQDGKAPLTRLAQVRAHKAWISKPARGDRLHVPSTRVSLAPLQELFEMSLSPAREEENELAALARKNRERTEVVERAKAIRAERFPGWDLEKGGTVTWDSSGNGRCTVLPSIIEELTGEPERPWSSFMPRPKDGAPIGLNVQQSKLMNEMMAEWNET